MSDAPERIWLRKVERDGHEGWTQCSGHDDGEVEYVRADLVSPSLSAAAERAVNKIAEQIGDWKPQEVVDQMVAIITAELVGVEAGWLPIKDAPKDGTEVLLWSPPIGVVHASWQDELGCVGWAIKNGRGLLWPDAEPTLWTPQPLPPKESK